MHVFDQNWLNFLPRNLEMLKLYKSIASFTPIKSEFKILSEIFLVVSH